jgi:hypothetical protein
MMSSDNITPSLPMLREKPALLPRSTVVLELSSDSYFGKSPDKKNSDSFLNQLPNARNFKPGTITTATSKSVFDFSQLSKTNFKPALITSTT